jgi:uncharacterized membrane protein YfcA
LELDVAGLGFTAILLLSAFVMLGTLYQTATGAGLALIINPALLLAVESTAAIQISILLSLLLTVAVVPFEWRHADIRSTATLAILAALGAPFGLLILLHSPSGLLKILCGLAIIVATVQLYRSGQAASAHGRALFLPGGALIAGVMSGALAMPGPAALWALLNTELDVVRLRASLRVFFAVIYGLVLLMHLAMGGLQAVATSLSVVLVPAMLAGIAAGLVVRRRIGEGRLRSVMIVTLLLMGIASLIGGLRGG